jgi:hypothetical protein
MSRIVVELLWIIGGIVMLLDFDFHRVMGFGLEVESLTSVPATKPSRDQLDASTDRKIPVVSLSVRYDEVDRIDPASRSRDAITAGSFQPDLVP